MKANLFGSPVITECGDRIYTFEDNCGVRRRMIIPEDGVRLSIFTVDYGSEIMRWDKLMVSDFITIGEDWLSEFPSREKEIKQRPLVEYMVKLAEECCSDSAQDALYNVINNINDGEFN